MVKKLLLALVLLPLLGVSAFVWQRFQSNPPGTIPYPYAISTPAPSLALVGPILLVGDRMGSRLALFKEDLSMGLSTGLAKPLKVESIARPGHGLHRTLHQLEALEKWPKVVIYQGGSEELSEMKFHTAEIPAIRRNFDRYADDGWRSLIMLWPQAARLLYEPFRRVALPAQPAPPRVTPWEDLEYQTRLELTYRLYEMELNRLVELSRTRDSLLVLTTTPVNVDVTPRRTCGNARSPAIAAEIGAIRDLLRRQDYKGAYPRSKALADGTIANAEVLYLHGQVAQRNARTQEALETLRRAVAYDCEAWRANEVTNSIIRKVAREQRVTLFDFALMVDEDWGKNATFFDEIYPQNLYYERAMQALSTVLKRVLRL